ncbi:MAG: PKD domain-containing protein [Saprospiraceae bacterium]
MRKNLFLPIYLSLFFSLIQIKAQDVAPRISGVVNSYTGVVDIDKCNSELSVRSTDGFTEGMAVLLIQMKGVTINEDNSNNFGEIENLRNVGRYEFNTIQSISGNSVFMFYNILNDYDLNGAVQVVGIPEYANAEVEDILMGEAWNGEAGGIIALKVNGALTLNADIDATAIGFRGGKIAPHENPCQGGVNNANNYHYERGNWRGAEKGEGVADYIASKELGRGPQANGGGGGNDHNSGGGGGANISTGGSGGERVTSFLTTSCRAANPGMPGRALPNDNTRVYFGGGGGAGHANNTVGTNGGAGGGIVIIQAQEIIANGNRIISNGESVPMTNGADGGGGGGAGGTVVLDVENIDSDLTVFVEGGNGGDVDHKGSDECFGPGGGGSGGRVLNQAGAVNTVATAGLPGVVVNSTNNCNGETNEASQGVDGSIESFAGIMQGDELGGEFRIVEQPEIQEVCPNQQTVIEIIAQGSNLTYQWQVSTGSGFTNIEDNTTYAGTQSSALTIKELTPEMMGYEFLLVIVSGCAANNLVSNFITLTEGETPIVDFEYTVDALNLSTTNNSQNGIEYEWDFGDGNTSTLANPTYMYEEDGEYTLTLTVTNGCGSKTKSETFYAGTGPSASFTANTTEGCQGLSIEYANESSSNANSLLWLFEGGTPGTSVENNPVVTYNAGGSYNVTLIVSNPQGTDTLELIDFIYIDAGPGTSFFTSVNDLDVDFNNTSVNAETYLWDFGNGSTSSEASPLYTYDEEGEYMVTLTATNDCGTNTFSQNITTGLLPNADFTIENGAGCSPVEVSFLDRSSGTGLDMYEWEFEGGNPATSNEPNPTVLYENAGEFTVNLTVRNNLGSSTTIKEEIIKIAGTPVANFDYTINENSVTFSNLSTDATSYGWTFGDANFSNVEEPTHTYRGTGLYYVTLNASNTFCGNSVTIPVSILTVDVEDFINAPQLLVYPNPTQNRLTIEIKDSPAESITFRIFDTKGQLVQIVNSTQATDFQLDLQSLSAGMYFIHTVAEEWQQVLRIMKN